MALRLLRVVYAIEFLMSLVATLDVWREVGGQGHLDLMPWYVKFFLAVGLSGAVVKLTAVSVGGRRRGLFLWAGIVVLFLMAGGLVTYYYHLNEPADGDDEGTTLTASVSAFNCEVSASRLQL